MSMTLLVVAAFVCGWLQRFVYRRWSLSRVTYERTFSHEACWEGDEVEMVERITNDKPLPLPWLRLEALMDAGLRFPHQDNLKVQAGDRFQNHRSLFSLRPYTEVIRHHKVRCVRRGCYDVTTASMTCGDLFGFSQAGATVRLDVRILVYPKPARLEELPLPWRGWQGDIAVRRWIVDDPFLVQGVREYRPGDPLRAIHWKASARTGQLQVHNRAYTADRRIMILLNLEVSEEMWGVVTDSALIEWGIRGALTLAESCLKDGMPVGFGCNGYSIDAPKQPVRLSPASGDLQHTLILQELAKLELALSCSCSDLLLKEQDVEEEPYDIVLVTAYINERIQSRIRQLEEQGRIVQVLPLEREGGERYAAG